MIGLYASGATASKVAKNHTKNLYQLFKELQGANSEFKLITPISIIGTISGLFWDHFGTILGPSWDYFGTILGTILGQFWDYLGTILG